MKHPAKIYDCLKKFVYLDGYKNIFKVKRTRNSTKIIKVFQNKKFR